MPAEDTQPLSEHQTHLSEHFEWVQSSGRPLFVTENGKTAAVVLSPDRYDEMLNAVEAYETLQSIQRGMEDVKAGRTTDARESLRAIAQRHDLKFDR